MTTMNHSTMKFLYERGRENIAKAVLPQYKREVNIEKVNAGRAALREELKAYNEERNTALTKEISMYRARSEMIIPDGTDAAALLYTEKVLTQKWRGMAVKDIMSDWKAAIDRKDAVASVVYAHAAPYAISENLAREVTTITTLDGPRPGRRKWDGKPYEGKDVLELKDLTVQFVAPEAHKAKLKVAELEAELYDLKITYSAARVLTEGLRYNDTDNSVIDGHGDDARGQIRAGF